ncbi:MAG: hypothetical protein ACUVWQ_09435 [Candidatus Aminicenantales bacterium]
MKLKLIGGIIFFALIFGSIWPQSLVELAKKEKERRDSLKDKKVVVVTNEDLGRVKRGVALETGRASTPPQEQTATQTLEESGTQRQASPVMPVNLDRESPVIFPRASGDDQKSLEERYQKAKEYVELLTLKLNALWQEFYSLDDMTPRDTIQQAIAETFLKLQNAQEEEDKARDELEKYLSRAKKASVPSLWVK